MEENDASDLRVKGFSQVDLSSDNDASSSSSFAPPPSLSDNQSSETKLLETSEPGGTSNLRNSLAWDSEFFTSFGVLDPEELSIITEGVEKVKNNPLSGIKKEMCRSTDSIATLLSENLSLESLEAELFEDIRASIKKSSKASIVVNSSSKVASVGMDPKSNRASNTANSSCKVASGRADIQAICSSNKDIASRKRLNSKPASKMTAIGMQGSGKTMKQDSGCLQITQSIARIGDAARCPNVISRANSFSTVTTKRASLGANRVKNEIYHAKSTTGSSKGTQPSKVTGLGGPCRAVSKPALSFQSSLASATATKRQPTRFSSTCDSSGSASPGNNSKSRSISMTRSIDSRTVEPSSGGSIPKTSSKIAWRKKTPSNYQISGGNENRVTGLPIQNIKKASTQTGTVSRPGSSRSSRLQMPSPKIGVFSGAKSVVCNANGATQSQSLSRLPSVLYKVSGGINSSKGICEHCRPKKNLPGTTNPAENGDLGDKADGLGRNVRAMDSKGLSDNTNSCS